MTTTPETPEQLAERARDLSAVLRDKMAHQEWLPALLGIQAADLLDEMAAGLLVGATTEEQIERALDALSRFNEWTDNPRGAMRAALAAAGVAPQEHEHTWGPESTPPRRTCGCDEKPAPSPDREKLLAAIGRGMLPGWSGPGEPIAQSYLDRLNRAVDEVAALAAGVATQDGLVIEIVSALDKQGPVDDARENLHAKCDCVPELGPAHCHLCGAEQGEPVPWHECSAVRAAAPEPEWQYARQNRYGYVCEPDDSREQAEYRASLGGEYDTVVRSPLVIWEPLPEEVESDGA